jgi:hypothetical protein
MIYVKLSASYKNKDSITEFENILKIGYTKDNEKTSSGRDISYKTENPTIKTLYIIEGGTEQDERNLHNHFRKYLKYGNEWFDYNDEILEFFNTHTTVESLRELEVKFSSKHSTILDEIRQNHRYILCIIEDNLGFGISDREFLELLDLDNIVDNFIEIIIPWLTRNYPDQSSIIIQSINHYLELSEGFKKFVQHLQDTTILFPLRLRELCESQEFTEDEKRMIARDSSPAFERYYCVLGPERCRALGYSTDKLNREISDRIIETNVDIISEILKLFKIGGRYKKSDIKEALRDLYKRLGLNKSPKASDLEEYFELKTILVSDPITKKRESGFEILSEKL